MTTVPHVRTPLIKAPATIKKNLSVASTDNPTASRSTTVMQVTWSLVAGGAEMYALKIASGLNSHRYCSVLCAIDQGGALEPEIRSLGIPYYIMNRKPGVQVSLIWRMYKLFRHESVDVVHTHHFNQLFYSALGARLAGSRLIHTEHSVEYLKSRRLRIALRILSLFCHRVLAIGDDGARALKSEVGLPASKVGIIPAGVDTTSFNEDKEAARLSLGLEQSDHVALIVARLYPEKNHRLLLNAFIKVVEALPRAKLIIAGEGTERAALEAEIVKLGLSSSVLMLGVRRDIARLLAAADLFVLSSDREGLPIAVLEAMAAGRPVIATAVGDLSRVVIEGETGLLVPPEDARTLSSAIIDLFKSPARMEGMGVLGRRLVAQRFSIRSMIEKHESLYDGRSAVATEPEKVGGGLADA
ncbi:MAG: hypothetical protein DMF61_07065 [Blastocatellia bacterium AA13]|nr:MAG: hypothetical protein DMF61_07065 [Blastocatellia bacterium AA13]